MIPLHAPTLFEYQREVTPASLNAPDCITARWPGICKGYGSQTSKEDFVDVVINSSNLAAPSRRFGNAPAEQAAAPPTLKAANRLACAAVGCAMLSAASAVVTMPIAWLVAKDITARTLLYSVPVLAPALAAVCLAVKARQVGREAEALPPPAKGAVALTAAADGGDSDSNSDSDGEDDTSTTVSVSSTESSGSSTGTSSGSSSGSSSDSTRNYGNDSEDEAIV